MNLTINLATKVYINVKRVNLILAVTYLFCLGWLALNVYTFVVNLQETGRYNSLLVNAGGKGKGKTVSDAEYKKFLEQISYANGILTKRSYDWLVLLDNLEQLVPTGVSLRELQPSTKAEPSKITGMATGFASVRNFMENLENSKFFTEIYLTQQSITKIEKRQAISFTITYKAEVP